MSLPHLYYLERYRNKGTRTYSNQSSYTEASDNYRPDSDSQQFDLKVLQLPAQLANIYLANPSQALKDKYISEHYVNFCVHPQLLDSAVDEPFLESCQAKALPIKDFTVIPSSSTRTLFVVDDEAHHAVKVHFPFQVSRYTRKMRDEVVEQAVNVSAELENNIAKMSSNFAFLREVIGISFKEKREHTGERGENWGFVVRDMVPFPRVEEPRSLIPGFALYGEDYFDKETTPLLYDLIGAEDPKAFVLNNIMLPIVRHWAECFSHLGYLMEPHGQNVLIELDAANAIKRIVHRDLSVGIDMRRRRDIGLSSAGLNDYNQMEESAFHSVVYDRFMGNHFFTRLVECCLAKYPWLKKEDFTQPCQQEFARRLPEYRNYFPKNIWYFSEQRDKYNKPFYEDTGMIPEWRPGD
jgi:siderophore synthetase component